MGETLEQMQARHRKEQRDLQARVTNKKKNATKKTRKFVNDECAELERQLKERQEGEVSGLMGGTDGDGDGQPQDQGEDHHGPPTTTTTTTTTVSDITDRLDTTTLSPQPPPRSPQSTPSQQRQTQDQQPQQQQQQQQKPKRNRQKERLARRAAEQEAASLAAESEAAGMTDHRAVERGAMERALAAHALREHEIAPDGHCLFSAVADQLAANGLSVGEAEAGGKNMAVDGDGLAPRVAPYRAVRRAAADWIAAHRDEYAGFIEGGEGVDEYVAKIRDTAEWGGQLELSALANAYGVEIRVVQGERVEVVEPGEEVKEKSGGEGGGGDEDAVVGILPAWVWVGGAL